jgi:acyl-CoA synthetase
VQSLAERIDDLARRDPGGPAFLEGARVLTWGDYARGSDALAGLLLALGLARGERVGVLLPDGPGVHVAFVGAEKTGLVALGIGPRAGAAEVRHLLRVAGASALVSPALHRDLDLAALVAGLRADGLPLRHHVTVDGELGLAATVGVDGAPAALPTPDAALAAAIAAHRMRPDEPSFLNSTSGTTGMPKCVVHDQARWLAFHELAVEAGELRPSDVFCSAIPAPFGFGLWTAHFTPALLGAPTVLFSRFDAGACLDAIARHRVSVLAAVSTQFILLLDAPDLADRDLSSLRALFTGGERVPAERAAEFERRTGARVLQFYGSNETGALSRTTTRDSRDVRLGTSGRIIASMQVRLFDDDGRDLGSRGRGQPGCRGPLLSRGYWNDDAANAALRTPGGWMLTGDVVEIDGDGVLRVAGRKGDFIIRGGKNVSAAAVEEAAATHPAVALAAAVAMPDPIFGERVCLYAVLRAGAALDLDALLRHLRAQGASAENLPERLVVVDELPRSIGGKIHKAALREDVARRLAEEAAGARAAEAPPSPEVS